MLKKLPYYEIIHICLSIMVKNIIFLVCRSVFMSMFIVAYDLPTGNEQDKLFFKPIKKNLNEKGIGI